MRRSIVPILCLLLVACASKTPISSPSPSAAQNPITIELTIDNLLYALPEDVGQATCPNPGLKALKGVQVKLQDGNGELLNIGELGETRNREVPGLPGKRKAVNCFAAVVIPDAKPSDFYQVALELPTMDDIDGKPIPGALLTSPIVSKEKLKQENQSILLVVKWGTN